MSTNPLQACLDVLISPDTAFDGLHSKKGWWLAPFLLINASFVAMFLYYFANVDFPWLKEIMLDQIAAGEEMTAEDLEVISGSLQQSSMTVWSIVGSIFFVLFLNTVLAIYLNIATKFSGKNEFGFVDWFGLGWWISMPHVVAVSLSMLMVMFSTSGMISLENLSVTTFNSLILWMMVCGVCGMRVFCDGMKWGCVTFFFLKCVFLRWCVWCFFFVGRIPR